MKRILTESLSSPLLCMCRVYGYVLEPYWRPCPPSRCERKSHVLVHRISTSGRDFRYGGFRAWLRWIIKGVAADAGD